MFKGISHMDGMGWTVECMGIWHKKGKTGGTGRKREKKQRFYLIH